MNNINKDWCQAARWVPEFNNNQSAHSPTSCVFIMSSDVRLILCSSDRDSDDVVSLTWEHNACILKPVHLVEIRNGFDVNPGYSIHSCGQSLRSRQGFLPLNSLSLLPLWHWKVSVKQSLGQTTQTNVLLSTHLRPHIPLSSLQRQCPLSLLAPTTLKCPLPLHQSITGSSFF